jgi:hypothetical protein
MESMTRPPTPQNSAKAKSLNVATFVWRTALMFFLAFVFVPPLPILPGVPGKATARAISETRASVRVLHLAGTPYQIGYQHGVLLQKSIRAALRDDFYARLSAQPGLSHAQLLAYARQVEPSLPEELRREIRGIADGAGLPYRDLLAWNLLESYGAFRQENGALGQIGWGWRWSLPAPLPPTGDPFQPGLRKGVPATEDYDIPAASVPDQNASRLEPFWQAPSLARRGVALAAWGTATADHELRLGATLSGRPVFSSDLDPIVITYRPRQGTGFLALTWPGMVGTFAGLNESKLALLVSNVSTFDVSASGVPPYMLARQALQHASNETTALNILLSVPRTAGAAILLGDGKVPHAERIEVTAYNYAIQQADEGFLFNPASFVANRRLAALAMNTTPTASTFPRETLEQQLRIGRDPHTTALQALHLAEARTNSRWAVLLEPFAQAAVLLNAEKDEMRVTIR